MRSDSFGKRATGIGPKARRDELSPARWAITSGGGGQLASFRLLYFPTCVASFSGLLKGAVRSAGRSGGRRSSWESAGAPRRVRDLRGHRRPGRDGLRQAALAPGHDLDVGAQGARSGSAVGIGSLLARPQGAGRHARRAARQPGRAARSLARRDSAAAGSAGGRDLGRDSSRSTTAAARRPTRTSRSRGLKAAPRRRLLQASSVASSKAPSSRSTSSSRGGASARRRPRLCASFSWRCSTNRRFMQQHRLGQAQDDVGGRSGPGRSAPSTRRSSRRRPSTPAMISASSTVAPGQPQVLERAEADARHHQVRQRQHDAGDDALADQLVGAGVVRDHTMNTSTLAAAGIVSPSVYLPGFFCAGRLLAARQHVEARQAHAPRRRRTARR